jgi:hypothetical protein
MMVVLDKPVIIREGQEIDSVEQEYEFQWPKSNPF